MKCSVTADRTEAGLTGKHEVREDVNKRKRLAEVLMEAAYNNTMTRQWPHFPL